MAINHVLPLHEAMFLLALHDEDGTIPMGSMYAVAVAGAIIAELAMRQRIGVEKVKKSDMVNVLSTRLTGDVLLDEALARMQKAKRRATVGTWVGKFSQLRARDRLANRLVQRGILRRSEKSVLYVFTRKTWPTVNPAPEKEMLAQMRRAIFENEPPDPRTAVLIALAHPAGLLDQPFGKKKLKEKKKRLAEINATAAIAGVTNQAVKSAIEAAAAAMVAVMAATTAATVASS